MLKRTIPEPCIADGIAELLVRAGAKVCFGVVGTANFQVTQALSELGVQYISSRHECGAASMADSYSRLTRDLALVSVHSGPGLTNAITGIAEAAKSMTPMLVLAGDTARGELLSNFFFEQAEFVKSIGATFERLHTPETALNDVRRALSLVQEQSQTVVLSMPLDIQNARLSRKMDSYVKKGKPSNPAPAPDAISAVAELLLRAHRPLILAGNGALLAGAKEALLALGNEVGALLATSLPANGIFAGQPWSLGISGGFASPTAIDLIPQSDLILGFGASFTRWTMREGQMIGDNAKLVQIDSQASRLGRTRDFDLEVIGDARLAAEGILTEIRKIRNGKGHAMGWRSEAVAEKIRNSRALAADFDDQTGGCYIDPRRLCVELDAILPAERVLVVDAGYFMGWPSMFFRVPDEDGFCQPASFMSVGLGLASAVGAAVAQPDRTIVLAVGDGGFAMSLPELETAARTARSMCIVVFNDCAYGAEVHHFAALGYRTEIAKFPEVDFCAVAAGFGAKVQKVTAPADLQSLKEWVADGSLGLFVVDARITPDLEAEWATNAFSKK